MCDPESLRKLERSTRGEAGRLGKPRGGEEANYAVDIGKEALKNNIDLSQAIRVAKSFLATTNPVYFAVADRQLDEFTGRGAFDRSLALNVLFQPRVLIPDIFFFICHPLYLHLSKRPKAGIGLFEAALKHGIVEPAFRNFRTTDFRGALEDVKDIGGLLPPTDREFIASRLDLATRSKSFRCTYWPIHSIGQAYQRRMEAFFGQDKPPVVDPSFGLAQKRLENFWEAMRPYRDCIPQTLAITKNSEDGLRRGLLMSQIGQLLGFPAKHPVDDVKELLRAAEGQPLLKPRALRVFCQWMNEIYNYSQAMELRAQPNFPAFNEYSSVPLPTVDGDPEGIGEEPEALSPLHAQVRIPSRSALLSINPEFLLNIRLNEGRRYLSAAQDLLRKHTPQREENWREELNSYARTIRKSLSNEKVGIDSTLEVLIKPIRPRWVLRGLVAAGSLLVHNLGPIDPVISTASRLLAVDMLGHIGYNLVAYGKQSQEISIAPRRTRKPEVVLRTRLQG